MDDSLDTSQQKVFLSEDYLIDFQDDSEQIFVKAENLLVKIEKKECGEDDYAEFTYLMNRLKGDAFVTGIVWVSELASLMDDVSMKLKDLEHIRLPHVVEVYFRCFDAIRTHVQGLIEDRVETDDKVLKDMKTIHVALKAERKRIDQKSIDEMFET